MTDINPLYPHRRDSGATVWDDVQSALIGRRLFSTAGSVDYDYSENALAFSPNGDITDPNDRVEWSVQFPHMAKLDSLVYPHLHLEQDRSDNVTFTLRHRIQCNNELKETSWTTTTASYDSDLVFVYSAGTFNNILAFPTIDMTGCGISATLQFQLTRSDALAGDVLATFADIHVEIDAAGSREQYVK